MQIPFGAQTIGRTFHKRRDNGRVMTIIGLGYLGIQSAKVEDWSDFASRLLGMQCLERTGNTAGFRMDDRAQRLFITGEEGERLGFIGWEVESSNDLQLFAERLENAGVNVTMAGPALADQRFVESLIYFTDPAGNRIELFCGPIKADGPFAPGRTHSGFLTGPYGLGHAVLHVDEAETLWSFYQDVLGFKLSDFGLKPVPLYFFHVNGRHHSFALVGSGQSGFHHFMIEFNSLDDVGQGYDLAWESGKENIAFTLGRHTNDFMTSFYVKSPSGFFVENGWGGRIIDPKTWTARETDTGPSFWGHDRLYLPDDERSKFRDMRLELARSGMRAPPLSECPWLVAPSSKQNSG